MIQTRSNTYEMLKSQIEGGRYDESIKNKLDVFLARNRINEEQYLELLTMVELGIGK